MEKDNSVVIKCIEGCYLQCDLENDILDILYNEVDKVYILVFFDGEIVYTKQIAKRILNKFNKICQKRGQKQ